jgi:hypothetical protein
VCDRATDHAAADNENVGLIHGGNRIKQKAPWRRNFGGRISCFLAATIEPAAATRSRSTCPSRLRH